MPVGFSYPAASRPGADLVAWAIRATDAINSILQGRQNVGATVTLTANSGTTTVTDPRISYNSRLVLIPVTANAAAALGTTYQLNTGRVNGSRVITHDNNSQTDRTFDLVIIG